MYKVVVFDCDGTLLNTQIMITMLYEGYQKFYPQRPHKPYKEFICCYFFTNMQTKEYLKIPDYEYEAFIDTAFGSDDQVMMNTLPFHGILEIITELHRRGYILAINTNRIHEHMHAVQYQLGKEIYDKFQIIVTSEDVKHPKPAPDSIFIIQQSFACQLTEILFIGDSDNDAKCAQAAGCDFALAGWGLVEKEKPKADYILENIEDILKILN